MKKKRLETVARVLAVLLLFEIGVHAQSVLWQENFDNVTAPALPIGWITDAGFETSTSVEGPDSGLNNLMHKGATFGHLDTPPLNLSQVTSASLVYNARRTGSYNYSALRILGSADGGITFPYIVVDAGEALPGEDSEYMPCSGQLPDDLIGLADVRFRFETQGG